MFLLSFVIAASSAFILPQIGKGYGLPFNWITYKGIESVTSSILLFRFKYFKETQFNLALLLLNSFLVYYALMILYKLLNKVNNKK